ncbi:hypothetical protein ACFW04_000740 [Cataglyphis niger]
MTEEMQQQVEGTARNDSCFTQQNETQLNSSDVGKVKDNKKEKCRPMTKVVIRRLPPTMTQDQFLEQVSPLPEHDHLYFVKADMSLGQFAFSRAYINFIEQQDIFVFREKFDNYVFIDSKGVEYPAVVEFAPFQRLPKKRAGKKKDLKCGTIESDLYFISFLESLKNQEVDSSVAQSKTEYSYQPPDNTAKKITTTPLLEYLKVRKQEKQRLRDEKREERRRRDMEKRRTRDDPVISKVLRNPDLDKESSKDDKENKEEREKLSPKELKNRHKRDEKIREKLSRDREIKPIIKGYRDRIDDRNKEMKHRRYDEKRPYGRRDDRENVREERRLDLKDDRRYEAKEEFRESRDRKMEERRGKSYEKMRQEKKKLAETKKQIVDINGDNASSKKIKEEYDVVREKEDGSCKESIHKEDEFKHAEDTVCTQHNTVEDRITMDTMRNCRDETTEERNSLSNPDANDEDESEEKESKVMKRRNSLESGGEGGAGDGSCLRRHKSLDGDGESNLQKNEEKEKDKKDPRLERRIRNKVRGYIFIKSIVQNYCYSIAHFFSTN